MLLDIELFLLISIPPHSSSEQPFSLILFLPTVSHLPGPEEPGLQVGENCLCNETQYIPGRAGGLRSEEPGFDCFLWGCVGLRHFLGRQRE